MSLLKAEINANAKDFAKDWRSEMNLVDAQLFKQTPIIDASYGRLTSFQAWRDHLEAFTSPESLAFFLEAQNDALTSHVFACLGSWRSSLKGLRSLIDNVLFFIYYKDHPIEMQLWAAGEHKPTFSELFTYLEAHPARLKSSKLDSVALLRKEYSVLSKAVHASSITFRMTKDIKETLLWSASTIELSKWETRERSVLESLNLLLLAHFRGTLSGASGSGLRSVLSLCIDPGKFAMISSDLNVKIQQL